MRLPAKSASPLDSMSKSVSPKRRNAGPSGWSRLAHLLASLPTRLRILLWRFERLRNCYLNGQATETFANLSGRLCFRKLPASISLSQDCAASPPRLFHVSCLSICLNYSAKLSHCYAERSRGRE